MRECSSIPDRGDSSLRREFTFVSALTLFIATLFAATAPAGGAETPSVVRYQWLAIGVLGPAQVIFAWLLTLAPARRVLAELADRMSEFPWLPAFAVRAGRTAQMLLLLGVAVWLMYAGHRWLAIVFCTIQMLLIWRQFVTSSAVIRITTVVSIVTLLAWAGEYSLSFTPFSDLLVGGWRSASLVVPVAVVALPLAVFSIVHRHERHRTSNRNDRRLRFALIAAVTYAFLALALRVDGLLSDWIPYHRSFWVGPVPYLRDGGWLLWDTPSQYGFLAPLSMLALSGISSWQALYLETAIVLTIEAVLLFVILCYRNKSRYVVALAFLITTATIFFDLGFRHPFGYRLYPQIGLRFLWIIGLILAALIYACSRNNARTRKAALVSAYAMWLLGSLWSFEDSVLVTVVFGGFIISQTLVIVVNKGLTSAGRFLGLSVIAGAGLLASAIALIHVIYVAHFGHGPDWLSYVELTIVYAGDSSFAQPVKATGAGWILVLFLGIVASAAIGVARSKEHFFALPAIATVWLALWSTSSYFVGESFENHVNALLIVIVFGLASVLALERYLETPILSTAARASTIPLFVILLVTSFGTPSYLGEIRSPLLGNAPFDTDLIEPTYSGELARLIAAARISPNDRVILPTSNSTIKLEVGLEMPFIESSGRPTEQWGWLPVSPIGPYNTLYTYPFARREEYLQRYFEDVRRGGWLIAYHVPARCDDYVTGLRPIRSLATANYSAVLCHPEGSDERVGSASVRTVK